MKCTRGTWIFLVLVLLCFLAIPLHIGVLRINIPQHLAKELFHNFTEKYNKSYLNPEEFQKRFAIFKTELENIVRLNVAHNSTAHFGITGYSDWTPDEFRALRLNKDISRIVGARMKSIQGEPQQNATTIKASEVKYEFTNNYDRYPSFYKQQLLNENLNFIPLNVDWRNKGVLRPVRFQGDCGACYAYSVIEMLEAHLAIHQQINQTLSVQQMIDCARNGNDGCEGGDSCLLLEWLINNKINIRNDTAYPRAENGKNQTCKVLSNDVASGLDVYNVKEIMCNSFIGKEELILEIIANYGPVVAVVNASPWQNFLSGIVQHECDSTADDVNHAVLIVGYDRTGPTPHYIVENTWGEQFAEKGFIRVAYGNNTCGIATQLSFAKVIKT